MGWFSYPRTLRSAQAGRAGPWAGNEGRTQSSAASAMAWRWSRRRVFIASRARHRSTRPMVAAALAKALVALCRLPSTLAAPGVASSKVSRSEC